MIKKNIFISYRVKDTQIATGRLVDDLKEHIDEEQIFMDIDKIDPGLDFTQVITKYLNSSEVMLVIIGTDWRAYIPEKKSYRINDNNDYVRKEIASALERNIRVIPILLDGGTLPEEDDLPHDLKPLLLRQAYEISNKRWKYDCEQLIQALKRIIDEPIKEPIKEQTYKSQQTSFQPVIKPLRNKSEKYWIIGAVLSGILIFIVAVVLNIPESENIDPNPIVDSSAIVDPNPVVDPNAINSNSMPVNTNSVEETVANISGQWANLAVSYNFEQTGSNLTFSGQDLNENQFSGRGYIKGNEIFMQITTINGETMPLPTKANLKLYDNNTMEGKLTSELIEGLPFDDANLYLKRQ